VDSNILKVGGWYYAAYSWAWPPHCGHGKGQQPCLVPDATGPIRTGNILDPSSWRGWDGKDFTVTLVDPYRGPVDHPQAHVCAPVPFLDYANGTNFHEAFSSLRRDAMEPGLGRLWAIGRVFHHVGGLYPLEQAGIRNHAQPDVATRARRKLVLHVLSLIDPNAKDSSYATITDRPYLDYVRLDYSHGPYQRVLFRQKVKLDWLVRASAGNRAPQGTTERPQ
jgi:hypothetical protein